MREAAAAEADIRSGLRSWHPVPRLAEWWDVYQHVYRPAVTKRRKTRRVLESVVATLRLWPVDRVSRLRGAIAQPGLRAAPNAPTSPEVTASLRLTERCVLQMVVDMVVEGGYDFSKPVVRR